jgi:UDP-N-acetylglucosamine 2-epimerase (non-hydrolysing)
MKKLLIIVGTRPNYIKVTRFKTIADTLFKGQFDIKLVHTGQHFDKEMADVFFQQLNIWPDYFLNISQASANTQIAEIMIRLEKVLEEFIPDWVIVPGDVNSTFAAAICAHKCGYKLAHLESGLRSFDASMPEEMNRIITDQISNLFFVTEQSGLENLLKENKAQESVFLVGNTMIDTIVAFDDQIQIQNTYIKLGLPSKSYVLMTMHRPATVDNLNGLNMLSKLLNKISERIPVVFPMHPRTRKKLIEYDLWEQLMNNKNITFTDSLNYFDFQNLIVHCKFVLTDSGGIQEETTYREVPCLTLRPNTERPVTVTEGTNTLISFSIPEVMTEVDKILTGSYKTGSIPLFWDGKATERILKILLNKV